MDKYILSVDNGLTMTKAVIFNLEGDEKACSMRKSQLHNVGNFSEIDMNLQWENTAWAINDVIKKSNINPDKIIVVGNSGHGAGLYMIDNLGKPFCNAISSMDARTMDIVNQWHKEGRECEDKTFHTIWPGQPVPILYWMKKNEPDNYKRIDRIFAAKDWIKYKLTGSVSTEYSDASNSGLVNLITKSYDSQLFKTFGISEACEKMSSLEKSTSITGFVSKEAAEETGLKKGTPVIGGLFDVVACSLGSGIYKDDKYSIIGGTWNINSGIWKKPEKTSNTIKCHYYFDTDNYLYVESSATSAVNLEWFVNKIIKGYSENNFDNSRIFKRIDREVAKIKPYENNIIYFPFLHKSFLSRNLDGSFFGIKAEHGVFNLSRAVFEGVVFAHFKHIENLKKSGIIREKAVLSGGISNSEVWCQMFSDILNFEIITTKSTQVGALGIAVCAAVALGIYGSYEEAVGVMVKEKSHYYPDKQNNKIYMEQYQRFNEIIHLFDNSCGSSM